MGILNFAVQAVRFGIFMLFLLMAALAGFQNKRDKCETFLDIWRGWSGSLLFIGSGNGGRCTGIGAEPKAAAGALGEYISIVSVRAAARAGAVSFFQIRRRNW